TQLSTLSLHDALPISSGSSSSGASSKSSISARRIRPMTSCQAGARGGAADSGGAGAADGGASAGAGAAASPQRSSSSPSVRTPRSEEHTSELQSRENL